MEKKEEVLTLAVQGMYCAGCAARIENVLKKTSGIEEVKVNFATSTAILKYNHSIDLEEISTKIKKLGYDVTKKENLFAKERLLKIQKEKQKNKGEILLFIFSILLSFPLLLPMFFSLNISNWVQLLLATPVQFIAGYRFHKGAIKTILTGGANMDVLVSLGTNVAYFYSLYMMFFLHHSHLYFESSAIIISFVLLGKILEGITKRRAYQAIEDLFSLQPLVCHLWQNGIIKDIDISDVKKKDLLLVRPGENIPVDGLVVEGRSECNESLITGESLPVKKTVGDKVYSGTMNLSGMLKIEVLELPESSMLAKILMMVESTQNSKAPVQRLADIISGYFAYGVIIISILTFLISYFIFNIDLNSSIISAISVLVIACPCALGLATPIAILISTGIAAKYGILFRSAEAIENAGKINLLIFDKTGTLTYGNLKVVKTYFEADLNLELQKKVYTMIYLVESSSEHIIGKSIAEFCLSIFSQIPNSNLELKHLENHPGYGVKGEILEKSTYRIWEVYIGNKDFIKKDWFLNTEQEKNKITVYFSIPNLSNGVFLLEDTIGEEAPIIIDTLKKYNIEPVLATGDKKEIALNISSKLGIEKVFYELKPEDKLKLIDDFQKDNYIIGMVGDGINDAPALAKANVSFAMGQGVAITKESADINLIHNDLNDVTFCIYISKRTIRKIKQNLFFAFIYNVIGIPLAAFGYLSPMFAGFAMAMSSVSVVTSSLFLYFFKKASFNTKSDQVRVKIN